MHVWKFVWVGVAVTLFDFGVCTILVRLIFQNNDMLILSSAISMVLATFVAYFLHSRITWKDRKPGKGGVVKFFVWNMLAALAVKPLATWFFGLFGGLYSWCHGITLWLGWTFEYDTIEYLGIYGLATIVIMILNFLFYDNFVFGKKKVVAEEQKSTGAKE